MPESNDELTRLRDLLKPDMIHEGATPQSRRDKYTSIILPETNHDESYEITITQVPTNYLVIRTDNDERIPIIGKHADYCLIAKENTGEGWIIYIELKKGTKSKNKVRKQLIGAKCLIEYCKIAMKEFNGVDDFLKGFEERYVCVSKNGPVQRRTTKMPDCSRINNSAQTFLRLSGDTVNFRQCIQSIRTTEDT